MSNNPEQSNIALGYVSYLLRLWHTQSGGGPAWRASLEEPLTQQVVRFDTLHNLFGFLLAQTGERSEGSQGDGLDVDIPVTVRP